MCLCLNCNQKVKSSARTQFCSRKCRSDYVSPDMIKAAELWKLGYSFTEIAPKFGVTVGTISTWIKHVNGHVNRSNEENNLAEIRRISKFQNTMLKTYGSSSAMGCPEILAKSKATSIERYGVSSIFKLSETIANRKETWRNKYGVDHHMKVPEICKKVTQTEHTTNHIHSKTATLSKHKEMEY